MTVAHGETSSASAATWLDERLVAPGSSCEVGAEIRLAGSWCAACERAEFPANSVCPVCAGETSPRPLSASGAVVGVTAVLHQPPGSALPAPYGIVAIRHDEGITVLGPVVQEWEDVAVDDRLTSIAVDIGGRIGFGYERFNQ